MSDEDPIRWAEGGGPPGALELIRSIERTPAVPPALRSSMTRRTGPLRMASRTRMIGGAVATAAVIGGLALWVWPRPHEPLVREPAPVASTAEATHAAAPLVGQSAPVAVTPPITAVAPPSAARVDTAPSPTPEVPFDPSAELSVAQLRTVVTHNRPGLQHCYDVTAQESGSTATIRATVEIAVDGAGVVTRASVTGPNAPAQLAACVAARVRRWHFPARGEAAFPVVFSPQVRPGPEWPAVAPLNPGEPTGYLNVNSNPWSRVFLDGRDTGRDTPLLHLRVRAGRHRVGFRTSDGAMKETIVNIVADETTTILRPLRPGVGVADPDTSAAGPDTGAADPNAADRLERARQLMLQGNNNGVIALLQGARSQQELELLIATYFNVGNTPAKLAAMQRYIERYPTTPRARQYQSVMLREGWHGAIDEDE